MPNATGGSISGVSTPTVETLFDHPELVFRQEHCPADGVNCALCMTLAEHASGHRHSRSSGSWWPTLDSFRVIFYSPWMDPKPMGAGSDPARLPSIALINDYEVVVRGLANLFAEYTDRVVVAELAAQLSPSQPVDVTMYDTFAASQVYASKIDPLLGDPMCGRVVIYTWNVQPHLIRAAVAKGVSGYLSKSLSGEELVSALERVHAGDVVLPNLGAASHDPDLDSSTKDLSFAWPGQQFGLTAREAEVLALICQGLSNSEIVDRTYLSMNTLKTYIRTGYRKIGITTRSQAVRWGLTHAMDPDTTRSRLHPTNWTPSPEQSPGEQGRGQLTDR